MNNFSLNSSTRQFRNSPNKGIKVLSLIFIILLSLLISAPIVIIVYRYFPNILLDVGISLRIDLILSFLLVYVPVFSILRFLGRKVIIGFVSTFIILMSLFQLLNIYSFNQIKNSYFELLNYVENTPIKIPFLAEEKMTIRNAEKINEAIDYQNPALRQFAVKSALNYFNDKELYRKYGNVIRYFSIFKTINQWNYISDPQGLDYFAKASESAQLLAGDCDDHAILMAASIIAIGGEARLVHTEQHLYPEVNIGKVSELSEIYKLIKRQLFYKESMGKKIYYRVDENENVWMNFDYTDHYPGSKYLNNKIIGILKPK